MIQDTFMACSENFSLLKIQEQQPQSYVLDPPIEEHENPIEDPLLSSQPGQVCINMIQADQQLYD